MPKSKIIYFYGLSILSIVFVFCYYFFLNNPNDINTKKTQKIIEINNECLAEWSVLNKDVYFRRNLAFYYTDLKVIRLYFEIKDPQHTFSSKRDLNSIYLAVYLNNNITEIVLNTPYNKVVHQYDFYSLEYVEFKFNLTKIIEPLKVKVKNKDKESTSFISLIIKPFRVKDEFKKNHSMLCSKVYYFKSDYFKEFKWWIEMNRIHGYSKIVIYNNSIENSPELNNFFNQNKDFVHLIQFKCIPNFMTRNNLNKMFLTNFNEIAQYGQPVLHVHVHFEQLVFNECYLQNMDKYKFITVNDQDETIVPPYLQNYIQQQENDLVKDSENFMKKAESLCYYSRNKQINETNIEIYLNSLLNNYENKTSTFHFKMGVYMKQKTMDLIFNEIEKLNFIDEITDYNYTIRIYDDQEFNYWKQKLDFKIAIKSKEEYEYAQYLYEVYKTVYKPFFKQNKDYKSDKIPESFNRLFYLLGPSTTWFGGKTIHNTLLTESLTTHDARPLDDSVKIVPIEKGYSSHFRKNYNLDWNEKSIKEFRFDLNYFLCYYKPILKKFSK